MRRLSGGQEVTHQSGSATEQPYTPRKFKQGQLFVRSKPTGRRKSKITLAVWILF